jgi:hypothetical protein
MSTFYEACHWGRYQQNFEVKVLPQALLPKIWIYIALSEWIRMSLLRVQQGIHWNRTLAKEKERNWQMGLYDIKKTSTQQKKWFLN